jgi:hypothetical protein
MNRLLVAAFLGLVALSVGEGDPNSQGFTKAKIESGDGRRLNSRVKRSKNMERIRSDLITEILRLEESLESKHIGGAVSSNDQDEEVKRDEDEIQELLEDRGFHKKANNAEL